jgi:predicted NBD/HSP70 family sugar kinase
MATDPAANGIETESPTTPEVPQQVLVVDIGGTKIKILATGQTEPRKAPSGKRMTPATMVETVKNLADDWEYQAISIGFPGLVGHHGPRSEPGNLGSGWVGFDYAAAFGMPVRISNDAAMQALGSYDGGRMLFLGLGTGLGSALLAQNAIVTLELGQLILGDGTTLGEILGRRGFRRLGKKAWREMVGRMVPALMGAFNADYVVLGGGNSKEIKLLPPGTRLGHNLTAFRGGFRLWHLEDIPTLGQEAGLPNHSTADTEWRVI